MHKLHQAGLPTTPPAPNNKSTNTNHNPETKNHTPIPNHPTKNKRRPLTKNHKPAPNHTPKPNRNTKTKDHTPTPNQKLRPNPNHCTTPATKHSPPVMDAEIGAVTPMVRPALSDGPSFDPRATRAALTLSACKSLPCRPERATPFPGAPPPPPP